MSRKKKLTRVYEQDAWYLMPRKATYYTGIKVITPYHKDIPTLMTRIILAPDMIVDEVMSEDEGSEST